MSDNKSKTKTEDVPDAAAIAATNAHFLAPTPPRDSCRLCGAAKEPRKKCFVCHPKRPPK